jgi:hypothetical protein
LSLGANLSACRDAGFPLVSFGLDPECPNSGVCFGAGNVGELSLMTETFPFLPLRLLFFSTLGAKLLSFDPRSTPTRRTFFDVALTAMRVAGMSLGDMAERASVAREIAGEAKVPGVGSTDNLHGGGHPKCQGHMPCFVYPVNENMLCFSLKRIFSNFLFLFFKFLFLFFGVSTATRAYTPSENDARHG